VEKATLGERALAVPGLAEPATEIPRVPVDHSRTAVKPSPEFAALPPSTHLDAPTRLKPIAIASDNGGEIAAYIVKYRALAAAGSTFRIDGRCASACTVVLAYSDRVCVTKRAVLGFHEARDKSGKRLQRGTDYMMSTYPAPVQEYISAHGGLPPPSGMLWVTGPALRGLVKPCE
jgi:hypothetical protein